MTTDERSREVLDIAYFKGVAVALNNIVSPREYRWGIDRTAQGQPRHPAHLGRQLHRPQHRLAWHAREVLAFPARKAAFDHGNRQTSACGGRSGCMRARHLDR